MTRLIHEFISGDAEELILVFHSLHPAGWTSFFGEPQLKYDFFKIVNSLGISALFFMDTQKGWYQGLFEDIFAIIEACINAHDFRRVSAMGASCGGYAAIVTAAQIPEVNTCLAFGAQTDLRESTIRSLHSKFGVPAGFTAFSDHHLVTQPQFLDCLPLVRETRGVKFHLVYSADSAWDKYYARYIEDVGSVVCKGYPYGDHNIGEFLLRKELLVPTIKVVLRS